MPSTNGGNLVASRVISSKGVRRLVFPRDFGRWPLVGADAYLNTMSSSEGPIERRGRGSTWCVVLATLRALWETQNQIGALEASPFFLPICRVAARTAAPIRRCERVDAHRL